MDAVAFMRTMTIVAEFPNTLRGMLESLTDVQLVPLFRLYSIVVETPVIMF